MNAAVQTAHTAYRSAADLAPERPVDRVVHAEFAQRRPMADPRGELTWDATGRWLNSDLEVRTDHLVAAGGAVFFLIAGLACGAWLQIG